VLWKAATMRLLLSRGSRGNILYFISYLEKSFDEIHCLVLSLSGELVALTTRFTDELMSQGLTKRILTLVSEISVTREFERLQKERGLGNEKHRKEVGANLLY